MSHGGRRGRARSAATVSASTGRLRLQARRGDALARRVGRGVLLCLLALAPLVFSRRTLEAFEFPKVLLLTAAAVVLASGALALAFERVLADGPQALRSALAGVVRHEPLAWGLLLYLTSAAWSTFGRRSRSCPSSSTRAARSC